MPNHMKHRKPPRRGVSKPKRYGAAWAPRMDFDNPRYTRFTGRTGRLPLTLIDGSTRANAARDIEVMAASIHFARPCYAFMLQRIAFAVANSLDAAGQITAKTGELSAANILVVEVTLSDPTEAETTFSETTAPP